MLFQFFLYKDRNYSSIKTSNVQFFYLFSLLISQIPFFINSLQFHITKGLTCWAFEFLNKIHQLLASILDNIEKTCLPHQQGRCWSGCTLKDPCFSSSLVLPASEFANNLHFSLSFGYTSNRTRYTLPASTDSIYW